MPPRKRTRRQPATSNQQRRVVTNVTERPVTRGHCSVQLSFRLSLPERRLTLTEESTMNTQSSSNRIHSSIYRLFVAIVLIAMFVPIGQAGETERTSRSGRSPRKDDRCC